jgi:hypothetical protein
VGTIGHRQIVSSKNRPNDLVTQEKTTATILPSFGITDLFEMFFEEKSNICFDGEKFCISYPFSHESIH